MEGKLVIKKEVRPRKEEREVEAKKRLVRREPEARVATETSLPILIPEKTPVLREVTLNVQLHQVVARRAEAKVPIVEPMRPPSLLFSLCDVSIRPVRVAKRVFAVPILSPEVALRIPATGLVHTVGPVERKPRLLAVPLLRPSEPKPPQRIELLTKAGAPPKLLDVVKGVIVATKPAEKIKLSEVESPPANALELLLELEPERLKAFLDAINESRALCVFLVPAKEGTSFFYGEDTLRKILATEYKRAYGELEAAHGIADLSGSAHVVTIPRKLVETCLKAILKKHG